MKKFSLIIGLMIMSMIIPSKKMNAQNDTAYYLVMKVDDAILDCPHFQGLFRQMALRNNWKEIERNYKDKYVIYSFSKNVNYSIVEKFKDELKGMNFPMSVVKDIYVKENLLEMKKSIDQ
ncbi:MAG: hypothetical protein N2203_08340 [Bacteroidia bacterium]|nr:hypothetical protein [Bacteroidia bacterium]